MEAKEQEQTVDDRIRRLTEAVGFDDPDFVASLYDAVEDDGTYHDHGVPAVVYAAVRIRGDPTKPAEVVEAYDGDIDKNRLMKDTRAMVGELPFDVDLTGVESRYVERYVDDLGLPERVRDKALSMCEAAVDAGLSNGKAPSAFAASCVYAAASVMNDVDVTQDEVAEVAGVTSTVVRRHYRGIIGASLNGDGGEDTPAAYVEQVIDRLGNLPQVVVDEAEDIVDLIDPEEAWVRRCMPAGVAASIVYVAAERSRFDVSQSEVAEAANVSRHTVKQRVKDVRRNDRRSRLESKTYNELKRLAGEHDVDVGMTPERDELIERLTESGVVA